MSPTPPSTSSSVVTRSSEGQYRVVRKRNRVPVSCAPCRNRKLKCNRAMPCENCVKRGDAPSCTYAQPTNRKRNQNNHSPPTTPDDMQNRIDRLESLVLSLMTNGSQPADPATAVAAISADGSTASQQNQAPDVDVDDMDLKDEESDTEQVTKSFGIMKVDNKSQKLYYVSEAHWSSILNDISDVKQYLTAHKAQYEERMEKFQASNATQDLSGSALIFGATKPPSESEIMSSFPSKYTTDILVSRFFTTHDPSINLIHGPTFRKEYAKHWQDPSKTKIVWIGMVFAMMRLSMLSYHRDKDEPPEFRGKSLDMAKSYRNSLAQCLVFADFTKPHRYILETLALHLQAEYCQCTNAEISVWILAGMTARLAMRMGYHREPKIFPNIGVFEGEMRRRIWAWIRQADLLFSSQVALPSMIRSGDTDSGLPRNLYDDDFDENCTELPPERPVNEPTPVSYIIAEARVSAEFGRVLEHTQTIKGSSYEEVMEIDAALRQAREMVPEWLRVRPISECENESASVIMNRFGIFSIYHKAQCVLHRQFLTRARENPRYMHSRRVCVESSLELLRFQSMLYAETRPDGRFGDAKWYTFSLNSNDFLIASTILALDLFHDFQIQATTLQETAYGWEINRQDVVAAIQKSREIWDELKDESLDAYKASLILHFLLERINQAPSSRNTVSIESSFDPQDEKQNAAMTLGLLSSGMTPLGPTSPPHSADPMSKFDQNQNIQQGGVSNIEQSTLPTSPFSMFGQMPDMQSFNLDWDAWDNYIQNSALDPASQTWGGAPLPSDLQQIHQPAAPIPTNGIIDNEQQHPPINRTAAYPLPPPQPEMYANGNVPNGRNNGPNGLYMDGNTSNNTDNRRVG